MTNWFREDGGPIFYSYSNRTSVTGDINMVTCCLIFLTLYTAFLIIFPGIRKQKSTTFITVTSSLFIGNTIMVTKLGSSWHIGHTQIQNTYCAFNKELIDASLGVYIGLDHVNVTLQALPEENSTKFQEIDYNERFNWHGVHEMYECYHEALVRGLPYPILTVAEYFSHNQEGFCWGAEYRAAGYYGSVFLWAALVSWFMMNVLFIVVPKYGAYAMIITSLFLLFTCVVYHCMIPAKPLMIKFEKNRIITFNFGWCYWLNWFSGLIGGFVGLIIICIEFIYPHRFSTILEVDFDTPYDRHIILEDSRYKRKKEGKQNPDDRSDSIGRRILGRLSSKKKDSDFEASKIRTGMVNKAFDSKSQNFSWRYSNPYLVTNDLRFNEFSLQKFAPTDTSGSAMVIYNNCNHLSLPRPRPLDKNRNYSRTSGIENPSRDVTMW